METIDLQDALVQEINGFPVKNLGQIPNWGTFDNCTSQGIYIFSSPQYYQTGILIVTTGLGVFQKLIYTDTGALDIAEIASKILTPEGLNLYTDLFYSDCYAWRHYNGNGWEPWNKNYLGLVDGVFISGGTLQFSGNLFDTIYQPGIYRFSTPNYYGTGILQVEISKVDQDLKVIQTLKFIGVPAEQATIGSSLVCYAIRTASFTSPISFSGQMNTSDWQRSRTKKLSWTLWTKISQI